MVIFYWEPAPPGQCGVVLQYSLCDTDWGVKNLFIMRVYTWCTGNTGHSAAISECFCADQAHWATVERKTSSLSPWTLTMLWKNAGESRAHSVPVLMRVEIRDFLCHQYILWSCINDWSEKRLWLITPSVLGGFQLSQVLKPSRIFQVWTLSTAVQHPVHLWLDLEANKDPNNNNLCWWQMRWTIKGKNQLRVGIDSSALHLSLPSPSFLHSSSPLMD